MHLIIGGKKRNKELAYITVLHHSVWSLLVLSLQPGWMQWFLSLAWRMRSAFRQSTITSCAYPATETQLRCPWSSSEHKVFALTFFCLQSSKNNEAF